MDKFHLAQKIEQIRVESGALREISSILGKVSRDLRARANRMYLPTGERKVSPSPRRSQRDLMHISCETRFRSRGEAIRSQQLRLLVRETLERSTFLLRLSSHQSARRTAAVHGVSVSSSSGSRS